DLGPGLPRAAHDGLGAFGQRFRLRLDWRDGRWLNFAPQQREGDQPGNGGDAGYHERDDVGPLRLHDPADGVLPDGHHHPATEAGRAFDLALWFLGQVLCERVVRREDPQRAEPGDEEARDQGPAFQVWQGQAHQAHQRTTDVNEDTAGVDAHAGPGEPQANG